MSAIYIFSLVFGGGLLALSLFGDAFGADADVDMDLDVQLDADFDVSGAEADVGQAHLANAAAGADAFRIFSIRGLIYSLFGFGAVGTILTQLGSAGILSTLLSSVVGGLLCGALVTVVFNWLYATDLKHRSTDRGFVGLTGSVTLPITEGSAGSVVVERANRRITLRALPHETVTGDPSDWKSVMVVEMRDGIARVAPTEGRMALEP